MGNSENNLMQEKPALVVAEFDNPKTLIHAAKKMREAGFHMYDAHSPFPIHGMDRAMGLKDSSLGWIVISFALFGGLGGFALQAWAATTAYRIIISGKPFLSAEAFIPVTFELTILLSAFSAVFGLFALNKLPMFYHPVFKHSTFHKASSHGFFLSVESGDSQFDVVKTPEFLQKMGGKNIEVIHD